MRINNSMKTVRLSNGLSIVAVNLPFHAVGLSVTYNFGSKDEKDGLRGAAHLLEHLLFRRAGDIQVASALNSMGSSFNGFTSFDSTLYFEVVPFEKLDFALELERKRMQDLVINEEELVLEKQIVAREIDMRNSRPIDHLENIAYRIAWLDHPYRYFIEGTKDDIMRVSKDEIYELYKKGYSPSNAVITIAGNIEENKAIELVEKYFSDLPSSPGFAAQKKTFIRNYDSTVKITLNEKRDLVLLGFYVPSIKESIKPLVLSYLLSSKAGRLQKIIDRRIIGGFVVDYNTLIYESLLTIAIFGFKDKRKAVDSIMNEIKRPLTQSELKNLKERIKADYTIEYNTLEIINSAGIQQLLFGSPTYLFERLIDNKEYEGLNEFANKLTEQYIEIGYE
jgi:zinc protease